MQSYKELIVWQKSMSLAAEIYTVTGRFPREEVYAGSADGDREDAERSADVLAPAAS